MNEKKFDKNFHIQATEDPRILALFFSVKRISNTIVYFYELSSSQMKTKDMGGPMCDFCRLNKHIVYTHYPILALSTAVTVDAREVSVSNTEIT